MVRASKVGVPVQAGKMRRGGIKKMEKKPQLSGLLLGLEREKSECQPSTLISEQPAKHTSGGLPAPRTIFSSIIARTFSFGSPMPTAM